MNYFQDALASQRSTILHGPFGRRPQLVQFYFNAIPELESASDDELIFWYCKKRLLHVLLEPPFNEPVPRHWWTLVLTSHCRLRYDPLSTRLVHCHAPLEREIPFPQTPAADDSLALLPGKVCRIDLSRATSTHEAYLTLLTLYDALRPASRWSLAIPNALRAALLQEIPGTGPYDAHLRRALG